MLLPLPCLHGPLNTELRVHQRQDSTPFIDGLRHPEFSRLIAQYEIVDQVYAPSLCVQAKGLARYSESVHTKMENSSQLFSSGLMVDR